MITEKEQNKFQYKNERENFEDDSYTREYSKKRYFLGIRFFKREFTEDISRADRPVKTKVGFK